MNKVVMLTTDQKLDRRIILEARTLCQLEYRVTILAAPWPEAKESYDHEPFDLVRIGNGANEKVSWNFASPLTLYRIYDRLKKGGRFVQPYLHLLRSFFRGYVVDIERLYFRLFFQHAVQAGGSVYHVHDPHPLAAGGCAADKFMAKLIYDSHELFAEQEFLTAEKRKWRRIEGRYIERADKVITINDSIARELRRRYDIHHPVVVRNCESRVKWEKTARRDACGLARRLGIPGDARLILYQGGLIPNRNLENLIRSMIHVRDVCAVLIVLGNGELRGKLLRLVKRCHLGRRAFLIPGVPQKELLPLTAQAALGIIPYTPTCLNTFYCTPNKLFEYIAAGVPVLVSDLPELRKIVAAHDLGWVTDLTTPERIAEAIDGALRDERVLKKRRANAARAFETLCWEEEEKKLIEVYEGL
jgi:glycosyltransferase involved in cell wall biosynthesis